MKKIKIEPDTQENREAAFKTAAKICEGTLPREHTLPDNDAIITFEYSGGESPCVLAYFNGEILFTPLFSAFIQALAETRSDIEVIVA